MAILSHLSAYASKALDGNDESDFNKGFCTGSTGGLPPWWLVDLGKVSVITAVAITNIIKEGK